MASGNAVIGALRIILGAETAAFESGLKGAEKSLAKFQANMGRMGAAIGVGIAGAAVALGVSIKNAIDEADKLGKMAQSFGIPVEQLSALKHAADLSGVSIEEVGKSVGRLSRSMAEIAGGKSTGGAADAFKALGISVKGADGAMKSSGVVLEEVADKFAGMQDGAGKTALAIQIFGRAGANMIPMLNQGAAGLREAAREAEELGLIIDGRTAKAAEAFNDNLTRLSRVVTGISLKVAAELSPALMLLTNQFVQYAKDGNLVRTVSEGIVGALQSVAVAGGAVTITFGRIGAEAAALFKLLGSAAIGNIGATIAAFNEFRSVGKETDRQFAENRNTFNDFNEQARMLADNMANVGVQTAKVTAPIATAKNALDEFFKSQAKSIASANADAAAVGMEAGARERLRLVMQAEAIARENNIVLTDAQRMRITLLANETALAAQKLAGAQLTEESLAPWVSYEKKLQSINTLLQAGAISAETAGRAHKLAAEQAGTTWDIAGASISGSFADIAKSFGKEGSKMAKAAQILGGIQALISAFTGASKALELPFPANIAAAAAVLAKGLAFVASIKSQKVPAFAGGGAMRLGGFASGPDSQLLQARIRPDEQVDIWRPGEGPDQRRGAGGGFTQVNMSLPSGAAGMFIENLINDINAKVNDGYRLNAVPA